LFQYFARDNIFMPEILAVTNPADIEAVAILAHEIWNQHYIPIIGQEQVDYMLGKFQNAKAIGEQINRGYHYFIAKHQGKNAGYFALVPDMKNASAQLSKIYIRLDLRRCGLGREILAFVEAYCVNEGIRELWLTVNRHNTNAIAFYQRTGFHVESLTVQNIGNGFVMDDYRMAKILSQQKGA
jgi:ribosomal protein S18 acetylase RimI-like enzyme